MLQRMARLTAATALLTLLGTTPAGADGPWQQVGGDARSGVSGIAFEGRTEDGAGVHALVVHDNKGTGQKRLSRITHWEGSDGISPITWNGAEPVDLEAIEAIPQMPEEYLALAGRGIVYRLKVVGSTATVVDYAPLPAIGEGDDFESFALVAQNGQLAALWADRGAGAARPAMLYSAPLTFASWGQPQFGSVTRRAYRATYPTDDEARHISDISVTDSGRIIVSSAADAGDDGPFESAVSEAGRVTVSASGRVRVTLAASPTVLGTFPQYKIEGVECLPGSTDAVLGTDDENLGGYLRSMPFCGA
ncbi:hypothetical protein [Streptomyces sp. XY332]|uniref:hypothetical protein n=1 Tax=Streptomyces sp. XY332 TaxID=1415561 RepID=UPI000AB4BC90|nr:hypothetical protein [Streptomyces sp. XY332]